MANAKQKFSIGKSYLRANYHLISRNAKSRNIAYFRMKQNLSFPELCDAIDFLTKSTNYKKTESLIGKPLPKNYSELGDLVELPILGVKTNGQLATVGLASELNSVLLGVRQYKFEINLFLNYKEAYEASLLTGDFENAEKQLTKIETEICYSLWSLENRFVLKELSGRASENKEFLSHFNEINNSRGITKYLAHYLSLRAEHSLSINRYIDNLEISLSNIKESDVSESFKSYYRFKLTFLNHIDFNNYGEILSLDFPHSIIDRYLNLTKVLSNLLAVSNYLVEEEENKLALKKYLQNRINYLIRKIEDPVLYKIKLLSGEAIFPAFDIKKSKSQIEVIDNYTIGLYDIVEKNLRELLLINPTQFDLYLLYIKSLIYQKKSFTPVGDKRSLQNEILNDLFKIISVTTNPDQAAMNLLRIANNITSCTLSYGIIDFVLYQTKGKQERKLLSRISYNIANPIIHDVFREETDRIDFLNMLSEKYPNSITVEFFREKLKGLDYLSKYERKIPRGKFRVELAKKYQEENDYLNAVKEWEILVSNYKDTAPIFETAIINLFECYLQLDQPNKCVNLYVDSFFFNNHIIDKIDVRELLNKIHSNKFRNVEKKINLPIFYTIVDADVVEKHLAFELFNDSCGVEKPSQLLDRVEEFDKQKFYFFLEYSCSPKVLMHSIFINSSKDRLEERLSIANFIKENDPTNKTIASEIKSIQNILVIQQGLIDLDESKIYVNEQGIIENELQDLKAVYDRFEVISGIAGSKKFLWLQDGKLTTYSSQDNTEVEKIEYSNNPVFDIYMELFNAVKDKFLNSQFGIVAYLSTRIRHGVLVGELRPIFETHKLITLKEGRSSIYRRNIHWDYTYQTFPHEQKEQIQLTLSDFASRIDGVIFDLIKRHLQVYKPEVNEEGWFDYEFDLDELWLFSIAAIKSENFEDFVKGIFEVLWHRTDLNLDQIRSRIQFDILNQFNASFNELEKKIIHQLGERNSEPIRKAIKDCSTEVNNAIQKISRWFKRSEIKASDFKLSELIDIVAEYTNKSSWQKNLRLNKELNFDCNIKGEYKTHFADLIRIFLENIIKHSSEEAMDIDCKVISKIENENILKLRIENFITDKDSLDVLRTLWKGNTQDAAKLISEGKSGYHKVFKILTSDLKSSRKECLKTMISEDENWFSVVFTIDIKDIKS